MFSFEIKKADKPSDDPRNWDKPSKALIASDGEGNGCILFHCGPHIEEEINAVGRDLTSLGLDDCPKGLRVWEGRWSIITTPSSPNGPEEYDTEAKGEFRKPNDGEWYCIKNGLKLWDEKEWLKNEEPEEEKSPDNDSKIWGPGFLERAWRQPVPPKITWHDPYNKIVLDGYWLVDPPEKAIDIVVQRTDVKPPQCDCGGERAKTTHSDWCSTKGKTK